MACTRLIRESLNIAYRTTRQLSRIGENIFSAHYLTHALINIHDPIIDEQPQNPNRFALLTLYHVFFGAALANFQMHQEGIERFEHLHQGNFREHDEVFEIIDLSESKQHPEKNLLESRLEEARFPLDLIPEEFLCNIEFRIMNNPLIVPLAGKKLDEPDKLADETSLAKWCDTELKLKDFIHNPLSNVRGFKLENCKPDAERARQIFEFVDKIVEGMKKLEESKASFATKNDYDLAVTKLRDQVYAEVTTEEMPELEIVDDENILERQHTLSL